MSFDGRVRGTSIKRALGVQAPLTTIRIRLKARPGNRWVLQTPLQKLRFPWPGQQKSNICSVSGTR